MMPRLAVTALLVALAALPGRDGEARFPIEHPVTLLPLAGPVAMPSAEVSGLAWHGDELLLLPQFPERLGGCAFALERASIEAQLARRSRSALTPRCVRIRSGDLAARIPGYEGFEAVAFDPSHAYLTLEADEDGRTVGYLVRGVVTGDLDGIDIEEATLRHLPAQTDLGNLGYESVLVADGRVVALHEANGTGNRAPRALAFGRDLAREAALPVGRLEYRLTDVTEPDAGGRFWAASYFWPGSDWTPEPCALARAFGLGRTHARSAAVERLVEMRVTPDGVAPTGTAPIQLALEGPESRNWEGIVRLGDRGFLLVTDEHPRTLLGFVAR